MIASLKARDWITSVVCVAALSACASDPVAPTDSDDLMVVVAYLFVGEAVDDIHISKTVPLGEDPTTAEPVDDATERLMHGTDVFTLTPAGDGRYRYDGVDLVVGPGEEWGLSIERNGSVVVTASTVTPAAPTGVALSGDVFEVSGFGRRGGPQTNNELEITWDIGTEDYHYVVIEGLDPNAEFILPDAFRANFAGFRLVTQPTQNGFFRVRQFSLEVLGPHRAVVFRVNQEYVDLFENQTQDSRDLNEPPSNIHGGLGIFSAFNGVEVGFDVVRAS